MLEAKNYNKYTMIEGIFNFIIKVEKKKVYLVGREALSNFNMRKRKEIAVRSQTEQATTSRCKAL